MSKTRWEVWWGLASAGGMLLGAFGPWLEATAGFASISASGTDGSNDGWLVVGAAVVGGAGFVLAAFGHSEKLSLLPLLAGIAGAAVAWNGRSNLQDEADASELLVQVGWGLNLVLGASISLAIASLVLYSSATKVHTASVAPAPSVPLRACPTCKQLLKADASVCPHCGLESKPWIHHAGVWWVAGPETGEWQWYDESAMTFRWYDDETPSSPSETDTTSSLKIDPALVEPPARALEELHVEPEPAPSSQAHLSGPTAELERLTEMHAGGALSDEEFKAAKGRLLGIQP